MNHSIGNLSLQGRAFLAPMALYTKLPFRLQCKRYGSALQCTELVSARGVMEKSGKTKAWLETCPEEQPVGVQLFGSNPQEFAKATELVEQDFSLIDINCGCSVPKALSGEYGAFLIKYPEKIASIVSAIAGKTNKPITLKTRMGWKGKELEQVVKVAKAAEDAGASAIGLHARSVQQGFGGTADWSAIRELKERTNLKVIGNGDVKTPEDAKRMLDSTRCDFVMVGRAAIGNPRIFQQINEFLENGSYASRTMEQKTEELKEFLQITRQHPLSFHEFKSHALRYTTNLPRAGKLRETISRCESPEEIVHCFTANLEKKPFLEFAHLAISEI